MLKQFKHECNNTLSRIYATQGVTRSSCFINLQFRLEFHVKQDIKQTLHEFQVYAKPRRYDVLCDVFDAMWSLHKPGLVMWYTSNCWYINLPGSGRLLFPPIQSCTIWTIWYLKSSIKINAFSFYVILILFIWSWYILRF